MNELALPALAGTNPLGFLAALGALDALAAAVPGVTLRWTDDVVPHAILGGIADSDAVLDVLERDRESWNDSVLLGFPEGSPLPDAKPDGRLLRQWFETVAQTETGRAASDHLCALVAEGAFDGKGGKAKPTHLHFTAGQQLFLGMVRTLAHDVDRERLREAMFGPWAYDSTLPSLSWDVRGERIYALRGTDPSPEKRRSIPGADWLAFRGLVFYPVVRTSRGSLRTTACDAEWKRSAFRWPIWSAPCSRDVAMSLVADETLVSTSRRTRLQPEELAARGITSLLEAPIRRTDQGGYGSFSGPEVLGSGADGPWTGPVRRRVEPH
ncbi:MAG: type I-G CRISPR-associated protein, Cas3-extension family [Streptosporangiaceae bacterium]